MAIIGKRGGRPGGEENIAFGWRDANHPITLRRGVIEEGFEQADQVFEDEFTTQRIRVYSQTDSTFSGTGVHPTRTPAEVAASTSIFSVPIPYFERIRNLGQESKSFRV
ncbi:MAG: hypothetical protein QGF68_20915 [Nitrospinota bacterium]|jgi:hypothetical protein|nr:hypothetical protein [Nitrospinota bacterium]